MVGWDRPEQAPTQLNDSQQRSMKKPKVIENALNSMISTTYSAQSVLTLVRVNVTNEDERVALPFFLLFAGA
jgi:hypothetical protein